MLEPFLSTCRAEAGMLPFFAFYFVLEFFLKAKPFDRKAWLFDWSYWPVWVVANGVIGALLMKGGFPELLDFCRQHGIMIPLGPQHRVVRAFVFLFAFDFFYYWYHRTLHTTVLWEQHVLHHSEPYLNAGTAFRHHWLENLIKIPIVDLPAMFVFIQSVEIPGVSWPERVLAALVTRLGIFAHSNLRIGYGPLSWLLVSPQTHRIHHSIEPEHVDCNFAAYFPILDVIFGTYYHPRPDEYPDSGVVGVGYDQNNVLIASAYPFKAWAAMVRRRRAFPVAQLTDR